MPKIKTQDFSAASVAAIADPNLRRALDRVASGFEVARLARVADATPEVWDEWRQEARDIKAHTIEHLD